MEDEHVIQRVLDGDVEAFSILVERHGNAVFAVTRHLLPAPEDREDVAQEAFLEAFRALDRFDASRARFSTWLLTIARNRCLNVLRRARTRASGNGRVPRVEPPAAAAEDATVRRLDEALAALPPAQRLAVVLFDVHGLSYVQIAAIENVAVGTVKSRIGRARATLRETLRPDLEQTR